KGIVMDAFVAGEGGTLADVFIQVKIGLANRRFPSPSEPVVLDQVKCVYVPHVVGLMTNQPLIVRNSDDHLHNVHSFPQRNSPFNIGQSTKGLESNLRFAVPETGIPVQCDLHPWMSAWIHVSDRPFFAVTGLNGRYSIPGLPPGDYEIVAWHERFPKAPRVAKVKVASGEAATVDFSFEVTRK
ncbi:MAG TPA: carboxypeptidase regulatory-like domain-containing protein, partial [Planctomycetota bacterium]|nr:carboxypeptidase regulatory-like domain-containing protein [Planctomycetota bacterium]